ncbi:MAG: hypothetical protein ACOYBR_09545 [Fluviibacter sp.]
MKARITTDECGRVVIAYDGEAWDGSPARITRTFTAPSSGGYVREIRPNGDYRQVCESLAGMGSTLYLPAGRDLAALIRREYRRMRRADERAQRGAFA